jgi:thiamine biosynthesis lipoprotein
LAFIGAEFTRSMRINRRSAEERMVDLMGTTTHIIVTGGARALADSAVDRLHELEARWSRFRPDSELSRLNERPGVPMVVSAETFTLVERAVAGWHVTGGRFDPTLLPELRDAGYDRSFELLGARDDPALLPPASLGTNVAPPAPSVDRPTVETITLDPVVNSIVVGPGVEIDPGGIGKGLAADMVVEMLLSRGAQGAMVSVGGDLRADGEAPEGAGWAVAVADPNDPDRVIDTLALDRGAVASTWRTQRTWTVDGDVRHHLIDPRTGSPASTGLAGVTVISGHGWLAEVLAKAAFLAGREHAGPLLTANGASAIAVDDDGSRHEFGEVSKFVPPPHQDITRKGAR